MASYWDEQQLLQAKKKIEELGYLVFQIDDKTLTFQFNDADILYYPKKQWASGRTIKDGRGLENLLNQIKP